MTPLVPAYFHPERESADWSRLRAAGARAGIVVVNPDTGPGTGDPAYRSAVRSLVGPVLGYVDTAYAGRAVSDVLADARAYLHLHGITGVFADRVTSGPETLPYYAELADRIRGPLVLNPGVRPHPGYLGLAGLVVTFEGDRDAYALLTGREPAGPTCHLVHGVPPAEQVTVRTRAVALGAQHAYATDRRLPNPWDGLPEAWPV